MVHHLRQGLHPLIEPAESLCDLRPIRASRLHCVRGELSAVQQLDGAVLLEGVLFRELSTCSAENVPGLREEVRSEIEVSNGLFARLSGRSLAPQAVSMPGVWKSRPTASAHLLLTGLRAALRTTHRNGSRATCAGGNTSPDGYRIHTDQAGQRVGSGASRGDGRVDRSTAAHAGAHTSQERSAGRQSPRELGTVDLGSQGPSGHACDRRGSLSDVHLSDVEVFQL